MSGTYLVSSFADKDRVKALGARWDPTRRQWYVPEGRELAPFAQWLPAADSASAPSTSLVPAAPASALVASGQRGVPLSQLLQGVSAAVAQAFKAGVWVLVEVVDTRVRGGHVYLEVSERDTSGVITAKANAVIWASTASRILPQFEAATGAQVGPGIKLLVRARPVFKAQFGFSLEVDAIDSDYTLGDLEARKREMGRRAQHTAFRRSGRPPIPTMHCSGCMGAMKWRMGCLRSQLQSGLTMRTPPPSCRLWPTGTARLRGRCGIPHAVFNNCMEDKSQLNAREFLEALRAG